MIKSLQLKQSHGVLKANIGEIKKPQLRGCISLINTTLELFFSEK